MSRADDDRAGLYGSHETAATQRARLRGGDVPVAVYGLGKMGLPLAAVYADVTGNTVGVDTDAAVAESVASGDCHVRREPGLADLVADTVGRGALRATSDPVAGASEAAVHVLIVPTLLDGGGEPDLSALRSAAEAVGAELEPGDTVLLESTVPPGTARDELVPRLTAASGLDTGEFGVAACPERTVSGQALADIRGTHPKVVGGVDDESTRVARLVYGEITDNDVLATSSAAVAEAVKVFEGVYRDVNIALANQLAPYAAAFDIDVREAIAVANTQPFCDIHDPGPGVGGHCIPVYPRFLTSHPDVEAGLLEAARERNEAMPAYTVGLLERLLEAAGSPIEQATVALLGVTYKADVAELRNAPSLPIARGLRAAGARVLVIDPLVEDWSPFEGCEPVALDALAAHEPDAVAVLTPHEEFHSYDWDGLAPTLVLDGRDALELSGTDHAVHTVGGKP